MTRHLVIVAAASTLLFASPALCASSVATGTAGGAVVVEVAGGVGGFPAYATPQEVQTYVVQQPVEAVTVQAPVLISRRARKGVTLHRVKRRAAYVHAHVKGQPVLVHAHAREIYSVVQK